MSAASWRRVPIRSKASGDKALVALLADSGLRISEARVRIEDLNFASLASYESYGYAVFLMIHWKWVFPFLGCYADTVTVPEGYGIPYVAWNSPSKEEQRRLAATDRLVSLVCLVKSSTPCKAFPSSSS